MTKVMLNGEELTPIFSEYAYGGVAIQLVDGEGFPYATATVWIEGLEKNEVAIKDWSENAGMEDAMKASGLLGEKVRTTHSGFVDIPVYALSELGIEESVK